ncbi:hypothetical protein [Bradyrhizobium sp. 180]|uniref:hypothetical protein n=1 Tax=Bradyrhizobium sp. 180 TaxID=2782650 RepID=UPI001FFB534C|nr:hypothetical protein [Bradyrhizobium sp. 180]
MARPEVTGRKSPHSSAENPDAYSVDEFCARHRTSVQLFYKNRKQMPRTFNVGARVLISKEAAAAWRREREQAARLLRAWHSRREVCRALARQCTANA